jgi:hypothetical protein
LLATGIVTITWENGRPRFAVNQEKVKVVEEKAVDKIQELRTENNGSSLNAAGAIQALSGQSNTPTGFGSEWGKSQGVVGTEKTGPLSSLRQHFDSRR